MKQARRGELLLQSPMPMFDGVYEHLTGFVGLWWIRESWVGRVPHDSAEAVPLGQQKLLVPSQQRSPEPEKETVVCVNVSHDPSFFGHQISFTAACNLKGRSVLQERPRKSNMGLRK